MTTRWNSLASLPQIGKDIKSLGALCSSVRWAAKSSVTWFGSPPGNAAHIGQIWNDKARKKPNFINITKNRTCIESIIRHWLLCSKITFWYSQTSEYQHIQKTQKNYWSADINLATFYFMNFRILWKPELEFSNSICNVLKITIRVPIVPQTVKSNHTGILFACLTFIPAEESEWNCPYLLSIKLRPSHPGSADLAENG